MADLFCSSNRHSPLTQYDLPSSSPSPPLTFPGPSSSVTSAIPPTPSRPMINSKVEPLEMTDDMTRHNPTLDYTTPDLVRSLRRLFAGETRVRGLSEGHVQARDRSRIYSIV